MLLEDGLAVGAVDHGGADLPGDLIVRVDLRDGEVAADGQPRLVVADDVRGSGVLCGAGAGFGCERHSSSVLSNVIGGLWLVVRGYVGAIGLASVKMHGASTVPKRRDS